jgi:hypothetical protein
MHVHARTDALLRGYGVVSFALTAPSTTLKPYRSSSLRHLIYLLLFPRASFLISLLFYALALSLALNVALLFSLESAHLPISLYCPSLSPSALCAL